MKVPRRIWETLWFGTVLLLAAGAWYYKYDAAMFLVLAFFVLLAVVLEVVFDIRKAARGDLSSDGFDTVVFAGSAGPNMFVTFGIPSLLLGITAYRMVSELALIPSNAYKFDGDPITWLMYASMTIAFVVWVRNRMEKSMWLAISTLFALDGFKPILLSRFHDSEYFPVIAQSMWIATIATAILALILGFKLVKRSRG